VFPLLTKDNAVTELIKATYMAASQSGKRAMKGMHSEIHVVATVYLSIAPAEEATKQLREFLRDPRKEVSVSYRRLIREVAEFCPRAATTTRELALHCLENNQQNFICPYHAERDKHGNSNDESATAESPFQVTGTPYTREVNVVCEDNVQRKPGHLHCGCPEDAVLFDFYLWKWTKITSTTTGVTEGWKTQRLDPRARLFILTAWEQWTGLTVEHIFKGPQSDIEAEVERLTHQIEVFQVALADAQEKLARIGPT
jgi:hypothetical protein